MDAGTCRSSNHQTLPALCSFLPNVPPPHQTFTPLPPLLPLPAAIPNRTLMSLACQLHPQVLTDFELDLCLSLRWGLTGVLRAAGVLL